MFYLELQHFALNNSPIEAVAELCKAARVIGIQVMSDITGIRVFVSPHTDPIEAVLAFKDAVKEKKEIVMI